MFVVKGDTAGIDSALADAQGKNDVYAESILIKQLLKPKKFNFKVDDRRLFFANVAFGFGDCWFWVGGRDTGGYGVMRNKKAHRMSWVIFNGPIPPEKYVLHKCDIRCCVNPDHLFLGTQLENVRDMIAKGRASFGSPQCNEKNPMTKFSDEHVAKFREELKTTSLSQNDLARKYGMSAMQASRIARNLLRKPNGQV